MNDAARRWNERYADGDKWAVKEPKKLLLDHCDLLPRKGIALDVACGTGVNGILLARMGYTVISIDISSKGLALARAAYDRESLPFIAIIADMSDLWLPPLFFDVILNFSFLERSALPLLHRSLKQGGLFFFETLRKFGEFQSEHYLDPDEAACLFDDYDILFQAERPFVKDGNLYKISDQLIARKH